jgi:hypothetical protein
MIESKLKAMHYRISSSVVLVANVLGIYAGREFMFVSPMPEPMPNKDKND